MDQNEERYYLNQQIGILARVTEILNAGGFDELIEKDPLLQIITKDLKAKGMVFKITPSVLLYTLPETEPSISSEEVERIDNNFMEALKIKYLDE